MFRHFWHDNSLILFVLHKNQYEKKPHFCVFSYRLSYIVFMSSLTWLFCGRFTSCSIDAANDNVSLLNFN